MVLNTPLHRYALSVPEFAEACGLSERHARKLISNNEIRTVRSGRRVLVPVAAIREYLETAAS